jgi:hypothetical protein
MVISPLIKKLRIKPGLRIIIGNSPEGFKEGLWSAMRFRPPELVKSKK